MRTFKLTVAYDGTDFAGWQVQPGKATIQGGLQSALLALTGERVAVVGSGRTDAGVHALGQVASFRLSRWRASPDALARALQTKLPDTIAVQDVVEAAGHFHALRDATAKRYRYRIRVGGTADPFGDRYCWRLGVDVDFDAVVAASRRIVGRHDFASFQAAGAPRKTTVRDVRLCDWTQEPGTFDPLPLATPLRGRRWTLEIEADGFLYNMVRNIVGSLVEVGRGRRPPDWIRQVMRARDRRQAGPTAPPQGLFLQRVTYPQ